jgi:hypothetical protein
MVVRLQLQKMNGSHYIAVEEDFVHPMVRPIYVTARFWLVTMMYHYRIKLDYLPPPSCLLQHCISGLAAFFRTWARAYSGLSGSTGVFGVVPLVIQGYWKLLVWPEHLRLKATETLLKNRIGTEYVAMAVQGSVLTSTVWQCHTYVIL